MNPMNLLKLKPQWEKFNKTHPKFRQFLSAAANSGLKEGSVVEITVKNPEGKTITSNLKITASDMEMIHVIRGLR